jgi:prepilin-type N-terminal cleavage/methylation domain-containing protein
LTTVHGERYPAGSNGFTLIEVLVVLVILGILGTVVVMSVGGLTDRGQETVGDVDRDEIHTAEEAYFGEPTEPDAPRSAYGFEQQLVPKYLKTTSSTHDVCVNPTKRRYVIVDQGASCPGPMTKG